MSSELTEIAGTARGSLFLFLGSTSSTVTLAIGSIVIARLLGPASAYWAAWKDDEQKTLRMINPLPQEPESQKPLLRLQSRN